MGHHVTGVDVLEIAGVAERTDAFHKADLNDGIPPEVGSGFDIVLAADVIEHLMNPGAFMDQVHNVLAPDGVALFCVPNIAHWYPRLRSTLGMFDYDQRGILDSTHLRFFTRRSIRKLIERHGFTVRRIEAVGLPLDALGVEGTKAKILRLVDSLLIGPVAHHVRLPVHRRGLAEPVVVVASQPWASLDQAVDGEPGQQHAADLSDGGQRKNPEQGPAAEGAEGGHRRQRRRTPRRTLRMGAWYLAARLAVRIWVRSPNSPTKMTRNAAPMVFAPCRVVSASSSPASSSSFSGTNRR